MDPRKRLQVLNNNNPSLRVSVAPQQKLRVATAPQQNIRVGNKVVTPSSDSRVEAGYKPKSAGVKIASFANNTAKDIVGFVPRLALNYAQAAGNLGTRLAGGKQQSAEEFYDTDPFSRNVQKWSGSKGTLKQTVGDVAQAGLTVATGGTGKVATAAKAKMPKFAAKAAPVAYDAAIGGAFNTASAQSQGELTKENAARTFGVGAALGGAIRPIGGVIGKVADKVLPGRKALNTLSNEIARSGDVQAIKSSLNVSEDVAGYLANETNPEIVRSVLKQMEVDPRIKLSDSDRKRLEDSGVSKVEIGDTPYGADYGDGVMRFNSPEDATPDKIYHEVGHAIWKNKMTPEERAAFAKVQGGASKKAAGREGYTADDIASEDFADYTRKAIQGRINEVPESLRAIVAKYAGIMESQAAPAIAKAEATQATRAVPAPKVPQAVAPKQALPAADVRPSVAAKEAVSEAADLASTKPISPADEAVQAADQISAKTSGTSDWNDNIDEAFPDLSPEARDLVRETMDNLKPAQEGYNTAVVARKRETAHRSQAGNAAFEAAGGGQAGFKAEMAAQRGRKTASAYAPTPGHQTAKDEIINDLKKNTDLMDWERRNTYNAFQKMWGDVDTKPTTSDIKKIRDYYNSKQEGLGDEVADLVDQAVKNDENIDMVEQLAGAPRTAMTIFDLSALRQLALGLARHPVAAGKSYARGAVHAFNKNKFEQSTKAMQEMTDVNGRNYADFMDSEMNIHFSNAAESAAEEATSSTQLLAKVPVYGKLVEGSNRAMSTTTSEFRFRIAKQWIDANGGVEEVSKNFTKQEISDLGEVLNTISGRGGKKGGFTEQHAKLLSKTLFSGRLWASRLNAINPYWYYRLSGPARAEALQNAAAFAALTGTVLTMADQIPGVEVGKDWRSADFGKIKVGNTRYDITGGLMINIRVLGQVLTGERVSSTSGVVKETTAADTLTNLAEGKLNPLLGFAWKIAQSNKDDEGKAFVRENEFGEDFNALKEAGKLAIPLNFSGIAETAADQDSIPKGLAMSLPGFFGAGVQTYGDKKSKDPATLSVEEKAKQATIDAKKRSQDAKKSLSKEDAALYKLGSADKDSLTDEQKDKFDQISKYLKDYGKEQEIPKGAKSSVAKDFFTKFKSMTKKDQEAWLKESPEANSTKIATLLNAERTKGLSEFKASNKLAKAYAEYEDDLNSHPEYTEVDKRNKAREFQRFAYKLNYSDDQNDIYNEGSSSDLRYLIEQGSVSKKDLSEAIKMDNELYNSGITGSLKFSKKFRKEYGYGLPDGGGVNANPAGRGSGDSTPRTGITKQMPSFQSSQAPQFSSKARTSRKSIATPSLPKGSTKRISIKL